MSVPDAVRAIDFVRVFPWLRMGRAIGCALAVQQWLIGIAAVCAGWMISKLLPAAELPSAALQEVSFPSTLSTLPPLVSLALYPVLSLIAPWERLWIGFGTSLFWTAVESGSAFVLWTIAGVAVARSSAQQFCRDKGPSLRTSLQWSLGRMPISLGSIITPFAGMLLCAALLVLLVLPGSIPGLGSVWLLATSPLAAGLGVVVAAIGVVLPILWPLMVTSVAVDDADTFGAFSRSFSYLTTYFWTAVLLGAIHLAAAVVEVAIIQQVFRSAEFGIAWLASFVLSDTANAAFHRSAAFWTHILQNGLIFSLFWSHVTILYLFLRRAVDGTPVDELAGYEDDARFTEPYPVVGMPAVNPPTNPTAP